MEQEKPSVSGPETAGVTVADTPKPEPSPSKDAGTTQDVAPSTDAKAPETTETQPEYKYLGKKYSDINQMEAAMATKDDENRRMAEERNELAKRLEALEALAQAGNLNTVEGTPASPAVDPEAIQAAIQKEVAPLRQKLALREEQDAIGELLQAKPHLAKAKSLIEARWRTAGNMPLDAVAKEVESLFDSARASSKEEIVKKQAEQVETGKGRGEAVVPKDDVLAKADRERRGLRQDEIVSTLPKSAFLGS